MTGKGYVGKVQWSVLPPEDNEVRCGRTEGRARSETGVPVSDRGGGTGREATGISSHTRENENSESDAENRAG